MQPTIYSAGGRPNQFYAVGTIDQTWLRAHPSMRYLPSVVGSRYDLNSPAASLMQGVQMWVDSGDGNGIAANALPFMAVRVSPVQWVSKDASAWATICEEYSWSFGGYYNNAPNYEGFQQDGFLPGSSSVSVDASGLASVARLGQIVHQSYFYSQLAAYRSDAFIDPLGKGFGYRTHVASVLTGHRLIDGRWSLHAYAMGSNRDGTGGTGAIAETVGIFSQAQLDTILQEVSVDTVPRFAAGPDWPGEDKCPTGHGYGQLQQTTGAAGVTSDPLMVALIEQQLSGLTAEGFYKQVVPDAAPGQDSTESVLPSTTPPSALGTGTPTAQGALDNMKGWTDNLLKPFWQLFWPLDWFMEVPNE